MTCHQRTRAGMAGKHTRKIFGRVQPLRVHQGKARGNGWMVQGDKNRPVDKRIKLQAQPVECFPRKRAIRLAGYKRVDGQDGTVT